MPATAVTVTETVVVRSVRPAVVPRTVRLYVPGAVASVVLSVSVAVVPVAGFGANVPVSPVGIGAPSSASATLPANPPDLAIVNVDCPDCPATIDTAAGVGDNVYAGTAALVIDSGNVAV